MTDLESILDKSGIKNLSNKIVEDIVESGLYYKNDNVLDMLLYFDIDITNDMMKNILVYGNAYQLRKILENYTIDKRDDMINNKYTLFGYLFSRGIFDKNKIYVLVEHLVYINYSDIKYLIDSGEFVHYIWIILPIYSGVISGIDIGKILRSLIRTEKRKDIIEKRFRILSFYHNKKSGEIDFTGNEYIDSLIYRYNVDNVLEYPDSEEF